ncbi:hypothetical protein C8R44DRAFT_813937 [Mycena epipterygia]|nr:hypothetical protein C8R44DRAFT_813937 [Mycena epipterygia]
MVLKLIRGRVVGAVLVLLVGRRRALLDVNGPLRRMRTRAQHRRGAHIDVQQQVRAAAPISFESSIFPSCPITAPVCRSSRYAWTPSPLHPLPRSDS